MAFPSLNYNKLILSTHTSSQRKLLIIPTRKMLSYTLFNDTHCKPTAPRRTCRKAALFKGVKRKREKRKNFSLVNPTQLVCSKVNVNERQTERGEKRHDT